MKKYFFLTLFMFLMPLFIVLVFIDDSVNSEPKIVENKNEEKIIRIKTNEGIISIPLEEYIVGVVAAEMPASFEEEALKAQAVAARTYVLKKIEQNKTDEYDITDTVSDQVYISKEKMQEKWHDKYEQYLDKITRVVDETKGEYLTYNGGVIQAFFFSTSSGRTENSEDVFTSELPYLKSVDSAWDMEVAPAFSETTEFTLEEFYKSLGLEYNPNLNIQTISKGASGNDKIIKINDREFKTTEVRTKLNLKSANFSISQNKNIISITTKGYGHDVGMSQYGALAMAKKGYRYDEILKYYYQGVEISKL